MRLMSALFVVASLLSVRAYTQTHGPLLSFQTEQAAHPVKVRDFEVTYADKSARRIGIALDALSASELQDLTRTHAGEHLTVKVNDKVVATPVLKAPLIGLDIELSFDQDQDFQNAKRLLSR